MMFRRQIEELRLHWGRYLFQSFLAGATVFVVLLTHLDRAPVIVASIGSTAFIVFAMPKSVTVGKWKIIGGHLFGVMAGTACSFLPHHSMVSTVFIYSAAVGLSILLMVVFDAEHPPASGTALAFAMSGLSMEKTFLIMISATMLALAHHFLKGKLRDLT